MVVTKVIQGNEKLKSWSTIDTRWCSNRRLRVVVGQHLLNSYCFIQQRLEVSSAAFDQFPGVPDLLAR